MSIRNLFREKIEGDTTKIEYTKAPNQMNTQVNNTQTYLRVAYHEKEEVKEMARTCGIYMGWDSVEKLWFARCAEDKLPEALRRRFPIVPTPKRKIVKQPTSYTEEQQVIIQYEPEKDEIVIINAFAGTGKTTVLVGYTHARPTKRFLYLAFNRTVAEEGKNRFSRNTTCQTIHACALRNLPQTMRDRLTSGLKPNQIADLLNIDIEIRGNRNRCYRIRETLSNFCASGDETLTPKHSQQTNETEEGNEDLFGASTPRNSEEIISKTQELWELMMQESGNCPITHDAYLKRFALKKKKLDYDYILQDEGQDTNPVTESIIFNQDCPVILVGDNSQAIYGFRRAENAMAHALENKKFKGKIFQLTNSFRFGPHIANLANTLLRYLKNEKQTLKGLGKNGGRIYGATTRGWQLPPASVDEPKHIENCCFTILARTNGGLIQCALDIIEEIEEWEIRTKSIPRLHIGFIGTKKETDFDPNQAYRMDLIMDVYHLWAKEKSQIKDTYLRSFEDYESFKEQVENGTDPDPEMTMPINMITRHGKKIPFLIKKVRDRCGNPEGEWCRVRLTTAHKSKGLEWPRVALANDFKNLVLEKADEKNEKKNQSHPVLGRYPRIATGEDFSSEEFNLLYIACTRAEQDLKINESIQAFVEFIQKTQKI